MSASASSFGSKGASGLGASLVGWINGMTGFVGNMEVITPAVRYGIYTFSMLEHPAAQAILQQYAPEMLNNPMLEYVINEPLSALLTYSPDAKPLFEMIVAAMNAAEEENG